MVSLRPAQAKKSLEGWIRSRHLICLGTEFILETVEQRILDRFEACIEVLGGSISQVKAIGRWPMGPNRTFTLLQARAEVPRPECSSLVNYWANNGSTETRFSDIET